MHDLRPFIDAVEAIVDRHRLETGSYRRWTLDPARDQERNPYGCADAANLLYTIGRFPGDPAERAAWIHHLRDMQSGEDGLWHEATHHPIHTTAHCAAALELFDAAEELVTVAGVPLEDLPRDGGVSIQQHQSRAHEAVSRVLTAARNVDMLYPESSPICTAANGITDAAEALRDSMRSNQEVMERAALNGANPGTTSAQRLAFRHAEQRARDAQANYADALGPVRDQLGAAFEYLSEALNTQIHGTRQVEP